jgi:hypothetical protein
MIERRGLGYDLGEIERLLAERVQESSTLDYKADPHLWPTNTRPVDKLGAITAKAVCAFANTGGGVIILGVDEDADGFPVRTTPPGLPARLGAVAPTRNFLSLRTDCSGRASWPSGS